MWDPYAGFEKRVLPNGLTIYASQWEGRSWQRMHFIVHSGSERDPIGLEGLAHFVEHLVAENVPDITNKGLEDFFEAFGGNCRLGATSEFSTQYSFFAPIQDDVCEQALHYFGQMLITADLEQEIEKQRIIVQNEFNKKYPYSFSYDLIQEENELLFPGLRRSRTPDPLGNTDLIERITGEDIRSFYQGHYTPANMTVVTVGGMNIDEIVALISASPFGCAKNGERVLPYDSITEICVLPSPREIVSIKKYLASTERKDILAFSAKARVPGNCDYFAQTVLLNMLREITMSEIREKRGWAYHFAVGLESLRYLSIFSFDCHELPLTVISEIELVFRSCLDKVKESEELFTRAKQYRMKQLLMLDSSASNICEATCNEIERCNVLSSAEEEYHSYEKVTFADVVDLMKWFRPELMRTLLIVP